MKRWTVDDLRAVGACDDQVALFSAMFPDGATADDLPRAVAAGLDVYWFVRRVVSPDVWRAYKEAQALLWRAYKEAQAPLWRAYKEAEAPLWRAYKEAQAPLWRAYKEAEAPLWRAYEEAEAPLLADALRAVESSQEAA